ncbi:hypothetical protein O0L34_g8616 [Tuta absoluta]|nr:hypothetical protein O0L34_g8616 [Tuta absoluta]
MPTHPKCRPSYTCHEYVAENGSKELIICKKSRRSCCGKPSTYRYCSKTSPRVCPVPRWPGGPYECPLRASGRTSSPLVPPYELQTYNNQYDQDHTWKNRYYQLPESCPYQEEKSFYHQVTGGCNARKEYRMCPPRCGEFARPWSTHQYLPNSPELYMIRKQPQERCCCREYHGLKRFNWFDYNSQWIISQIYLECRTVYPQIGASFVIMVNMVLTKVVTCALNLETNQRRSRLLKKVHDSLLLQKFTCKTMQQAFTSLVNDALVW